MGRFYGVVGYGETAETAPGVWKEVYTERNYYGDVQNYTRRLESSAVINDGISVTNVISIIADPYAYEHFASIRYVKWMGVAWKVSSVEVNRPRLILTLGGIDNGPENRTA